MPTSNSLARYWASPRDARYGDSMERVLYNTVLGAKPLQPDGTAFYYSDYSYDGRKGYSNHRWPCCSGTLPQVAADYRINVYFHDRAGSLRQPLPAFRLRWYRGGNSIELKQTTQYPFDDVVRFQLTASRPEQFSILFRIPAWCDHASLSVNGKRVTAGPLPGSFTQLSRQWKSGDRIELHLPMSTRLEAIDSQHPDIVALMYGPLVLFPVSNPQVTGTATSCRAARDLKDHGACSLAPAPSLFFHSLKLPANSTALTSG